MPSSPLVADDLLVSGGGVVSASFFPGDDDATMWFRLGNYLTEAYTTIGAALSGITADAAARAFAYSRAYEDAYSDRLLSPATLSLNDQGSRSYNSAQISGLNLQAIAYREQFDALMAASASAASVGSGWLTIRSYR